MVHNSPTSPEMQQGLAYLLGRKTAPLFFNARWIIKSLTGTETEKITTAFHMGCLLAQAYEEKIPTAANNRISDIAEKLVARLRNKERRFSFKCDQSGILNALAIPGGFIYLSEKLYDFCGEDRDAIAFVLAHEMAHTINGDSNKRFLTKTVINSLLKVKTRGISPAVKQLLGHLVQQGYSREQEFQADSFAVALTSAAGFDPAGGCRLFYRLQQYDQETYPLETYFASHPDLSDRIDRINQKMKVL